MIGNESHAAIALKRFVLESNRIEGIEGASKEDLEAHDRFLATDEITVADMSIFVNTIGGGPLRLRPGMDVVVGKFRPFPGGPFVVDQLKLLLKYAALGRLNAFETHCQYEMLHPYMDGNGRSGRALWLKMMGGQAWLAATYENPIGFLHTFYYQSLRHQQEFYGRADKTGSGGTVQVF